MHQEPCSAFELPTMEFDDSIHPRAFFDRARERLVEDWADLDRHLVAWLIREGHLTRDKLPIHNHAKRGKYYINLKPEHSAPSFDGDWHQVREFFVDTKYNASAHVRNITAAFEHLGLKDPHCYFAFRYSGR